MTHREIIESLRAMAEDKRVEGVERRFMGDSEGSECISQSIVLEQAALALEEAYMPIHARSMLN